MEKTELVCGYCGSSDTNNGVCAGCGADGTYLKEVPVPDMYECIHCGTVFNLNDWPERCPKCNVQHMALVGRAAFEHYQKYHKISQN